MPNLICGKVAVGGKYNSTHDRQSWFPKEWTSKDIKRAGEHVANLKHNKSVAVKDGKPIFGMWKGVRVGVIRTNGIIATIFPDSKQPYNKKGRTKK